MTKLEQNVMRRVRRIYYLRPFISGAGLSGAVAVLSLYGIGREVWVARVLENAPHDLTALPHFAFAAFANTDLIVQALSLMVIVATVYFARETAVHMTRAIAPAYA